MTTEQRQRALRHTYASLCQERADEIELEARLWRLRAARLVKAQGESLRVLSEAFATAERELRRAARELLEGEEPR